MGQRGPKPLPANVHQLRGNPSKKPALNLLDEFRPEVEIPDCPSWMWKEAKKEWKRITPELQAYGLISKIDRAALCLYCQTWAEYVWAKKMLSLKIEQAAKAVAQAEAEGKEYTGGDGLTVQTPNGNFTYSPYWVAANKASEQLDKFLQSFGLSPSSRSRVSVSNNRQQTLFPEGEGSAWNNL